MRNTDVFTPRPTLTSHALLQRAVEALSQGTASRTEVWRHLTDRFAVDLDAVATLLPGRDAETSVTRIED